jgi:glycosyltransferase involved in cell wall biosynthesis
MRVLFVARFNDGRYAPFIEEQACALEKEGVECHFSGVRRKGLFGYLLHFPALLRKIKSFRPDLVHAHYGLSGLLANLQRRVPVVTTFHGSDINDPYVRPWSKWAMRLSAYSIFVSKKTLEIAKPKKSFALIPCGINLEDYPIIDKAEARKKMGLDDGKKYALFAGAFDNTVKNAPLAKAAVTLLPDVELLELKGYSREQVACLMQAVDAFLMTSFTEGSPQVIKEAMACGCPIVSVDVGDVRERIGELDGCFLAERTPEDLSEKLKAAIAFGKRTDGRKAIESSGLTNEVVARKILEVYNSVLRK